MTKKPKRILILLPLITLLLVFLIATLAILKQKQAVNLESDFNTAKEIDLPQFSFQNILPNQPDLTNSDFISQKYSLLNIFASWCKTCHAEHPILMQLADNKNLNIYAIAFRDIDANTQKYLEKNGNPYLKVATDKKAQLTKILGVKGIPETFLINPQGQIIKRHQGNLDHQFIKDISRFF